MRPRVSRRIITEVQVRVVVGCFSWMAHGRGSRRAISRSNRRNKMATKKESD